MVQCDGWSTSRQIHVSRSRLKACYSFFLRMFSWELFSNAATYKSLAKLSHCLQPREKLDNVVFIGGSSVSVTHWASVTMDEEDYWWGRGTTSSLSNIVFWTLNKTKRKYLYLFDDNKRGNYCFNVKILWRKEIFVWTKSINPQDSFQGSSCMLSFTYSTAWAVIPCTVKT